jgi:hypothetical protein
MKSIRFQKGKPFHCLYVSALYDIYKNPDKVNFYVDYFADFAKLGVPVVLYCDQTYYDAIQAREDSSGWETVEIVCMPEVNTLPLYEMANREGLSMPNRRCMKKDTQLYMALMNAKIDFMRMVGEIYPNVQYLFWLDAAFLKLINHRGQIQHFLQTLHFTYPDAMLIPGCWNFDAFIPEDSVSWRFAGTAFSIRARFLPTIYQQVMEVLREMVEEHHKITWEVNVWAHTERKHPGSFIWYHADHNDQLFHIPRQYIKSCVKIPTNSNDGLGNYLKAYVSARSVCEEVYFEPCEEEPFGRIQYVMDSSQIYKPRDGVWVDEFYTCRMMVLKEEESSQKNLENEMKDNDLGKNEVIGKKFSQKHMIDWFYDRSLLTDAVFERIQRVLRTFRFQNHLIQKSKEIADRIQHPSYGIYVRTWSAPWDKKLNRPYQRHLYVNAILEELREHPETKTILLTIDYDTNQWDELREIQQAAGLLGKPVILLPPQMNNLETNQFELVQLLVLSQCESLVGARLCNLTELMFWFSGCKQRVKTIH